MKVVVHRLTRLMRALAPQPPRKATVESWMIRRPRQYSTTSRRTTLIVKVLKSTTGAIQMNNQHLYSTTRTTRLRSVKSILWCLISRSPTSSSTRWTHTQFRSLALRSLMAMMMSLSGVRPFIMSWPVPSQTCKEVSNSSFTISMPGTGEAPRRSTTSRMTSRVESYHSRTTIAWLSGMKPDHR